MTRRYSLVIEGEEGSYSAYVPELAAILVTGESIDQITERAAEAIRLYWETLDVKAEPGSVIREIDVEIPA